MSSILISPFSKEKVSQGATKVLEASSTLLRLAKTHHLLSQHDLDKRLVIIDKLSVLWKEVIQDNATTYDTIHNRLVTCKESIGEPLFQMYVKALNIPNPDVKRLAKQFKKDLTATTLSAPFVLAQTGIEGPTLLIQYWRNTVHSYVAKISDWEELFSSHVYACLAEGFSDSKLAYNIPKSTGIDLTNGNQLTIHGKAQELDAGVPKKLKEDLLQLLEIHKREIENEEDKPALLYFEKVKGENLFDFFRTKYNSLSPQAKIEFFKQIGRLSLLDVVLGHIDRLVQTALREELEEPIHDFDEGQANLGNVMVTWTGNPDECPTIRPIDNGLQALNEEERDIKYLDFIKTLLQDPQKQFKILESKIIQAINNRLDNADIDIKPEIIEDISKTSSGAIYSGLLDMIQIFKKELIPSWEHKPETQEFKNQFKSQLPELFYAVEARIQLFKEI